MNDKISKPTVSLIKAILGIFTALITVCLIIWAAYRGLIFSFSQCTGSKCSSLSLQDLFMIPLIAIAAIGYGIFFLIQREHNRKHEVISQATQREEIIRIERSILRILSKYGDMTLNDLSYLLEKDQGEVMDILHQMMMRKLISQRIVDRQGYLHVN